VLIEIGIDSKFIFVSIQIGEIIGYQPNDLIGRNLLNLTHPEDKIVIEQAFEALKYIGDLLNIDFRLKHKKGFFVPVSLRGTLVKMEGQLRIIGVLSDVTDRKRIEAMMKKEVKQLKELEQIRTDLINRISHEFNTPLSSIMSGSDLLLTHFKERIQDDVLEIIDIINKGGYRLKDMVDNLLIAYRIESGEIKPELHRTNVIPLIKLCIKNIAYQANIRGVLLNVELLDELFIEMDDLLINKVIINLLSNAIKNTPSRGNVFVKFIDHKNYIDIIFEDSGVGITKKERTKLFKKFGKIERFGKGMDVDIEGPGLGLYIANEIVKLHKGEILVKSNGRNKGSKFIIRIYRN
jgi:PAS domain S-box-containing protein